MKEYKIIRVYHTGIEKPHTIELENGKRISIIYYKEQYIDLPQTAIAIDNNGKRYKLFTNKTWTRTLAKEEE